MLTQYLASKTEAQAAKAPTRSDIAKNAKGHRVGRTDKKGRKRKIYITKSCIDDIIYKSYRHPMIFQYQAAMLKLAETHCFKH